MASHSTVGGDAPAYAWLVMPDYPLSSTDRFQALLEHSAHPYLRVLAQQDFVRGWCGPEGSVLAHFHTDAGHPWILLLGPASLVAEMRDHEPILNQAQARWTVPRSSEDLLGPERSRWDWWGIDHAPAPAGPDVDVVDLGGAHDEEVKALLALASPTASSTPGDPEIRTWHGVRQGAALVAVGAAIRWKSGAPVLASIATHPDHRGKGLARAITRSLTLYFRAQGEERVTLGMYAANDSARSTYTAVGYRVLQEFTSGTIS